MNAQEVIDQHTVDLYLKIAGPWAGIGTPPSQVVAAVKRLRELDAQRTREKYLLTYGQALGRTGK